MSQPSPETAFAANLEALLTSTGLPVAVIKQDDRSMRGTIDGLRFKASWRKGADYLPGHLLWLSVGGVAVTAAGRFPAGETPTVTKVQRAVRLAHTNVRHAKEQRQATARREQIEARLQDAYSRAKAVLAPSEAALLERATVYALRHGFLFKEDERGKTAAETETTAAETGGDR